MTAKKADDASPTMEILLEIKEDVAVVKTKVEGVEKRLEKGDENFKRIPCLFGQGCPAWLQSPAITLSVGGASGVGLTWAIIEFISKHGAQ
jgi:hypothetical protein